VCTHPKRKSIDAALVAGDSATAIAAKFRVTDDSVTRHKASHLPAAMIKAKEAKEVTQADDLLAQARKVQNKATSLLLKAEAQGDFKTALAGCREVRGCIELLGKLMGELDESPTVNIVINPQWLNIRAVIVAALADHPAARLKVAEALAALECSP
jgi:hypothetical protein